MGFFWSECFGIVSLVKMPVCMEMYRERQARFAELVDGEEWEILTREFSRSIAAWDYRLAKSSSSSRAEIVESMTECCRKSVHVWEIVLSGVDDIDIYCEALEAVGRAWDGHKIVVQVEEILKNRKDVPEWIDGFLKDIVNEQSRIVNDDKRELFSIKARFESLVFPKQFSSFYFDQSNAKDYMESLQPWPKEQEDFLQRLVFVYNDDPESWRMYSDWLLQESRGDDLMHVLEKACSEYVQYNPNMWVMAAEYATKDGNQSRAIEWCEKAIQGRTEYLECSSLETMTAYLDPSGLDGIYPEDSTQGLFVLYLRASTSGDMTMMQRLLEVMEKRENVDFSESDLCLYCYALGCSEQVEWTARRDRILKYNARKIMAFLGVDHPLRAHVTGLVDGNSSAPLPISKAPPKPVVQRFNHNLPRMPLPGYTPGWLAEEYAKKHNI